MMKRLLILLPGVLLVFYSCSASTDTRYETGKDKPDNKKVTPKNEKQIPANISEDFDITPYMTELDIPEKEISLNASGSESEVWYGYEENNADTSTKLNKKIVDKVQGYRVLLLTTDNLEEANNLKEEIDSNIQREVYVIFDPPFYKVMVGDFLKYSEASDLSFKMNQLGYAEARVVNETVNIFE